MLDSLKRPAARCQLRALSWIFTVAILCGVSGGCGGNAGSSPVPVREQVSGALMDWMDAFNTGDTSKVCDLFASDLISDYQGQPERGYAAVCNLLISSLNDQTRKYHYSLNIKEILVSGRLAMVRLVWTLSVTRNGSTFSGDEPGMDVFQPQQDGSWKVIRFISYPANPDCAD
ncbi:MAG TPA: nuclear transport factor 2 family protein [Candidatus Binataceae bacterium]|nr:nuclear transport factor 2 family protein [Candidatus Binataceae bacterium]